jgi:hypothetical protein
MKKEQLKRNELWILNPDVYPKNDRLHNLNTVRSSNPQTRPGEDFAKNFWYLTLKFD